MSRSAGWGISLKRRYNSIRFGIWRILFTFSMIILLLIGALQVLLIKPYYRNERITTIAYLADLIEDNLILAEEVSSTKTSAIFNAIVNNNVCVLVYGEDGKTLYRSDALGMVCAFNDDINLGAKTINVKHNQNELIDLLRNGDDVYSSSLISKLTDKEMLLYGRKVKAPFANYYLFINSPLEPIESVVNFFMHQFAYIAFFVFLISLLIALLLANRFSKPIEKMKKSADKLAKGDYNVDFNVKSYEEVEELAATLNDATDKLSKIEELRKDLLANISHDIKTPLTMIKAYGEMIKDISGDDPPKRNAHLDVIIREVNYLDRLVGDMRELAKMQAGYTSLHRDNVDMAKLIREAIEMQAAGLAEHHLTVVTELFPAIVWVDELKFRQVLNNFISNAIKYSYEGGRITIRMRDSEERLRVEISDEGCGIAAEDLPYIWDRYFKIDKQFSRSIKSTGLGLAIVKAILDLHQAKYGVQSTVAKGSTFYFEIDKDYENACKN